jgi:hypothetical protein
MLLPSIQGITWWQLVSGGAYLSSLVQGAKYSDEALEKERDGLAKALERLGSVQHELAMGQHELMAGQKALADQQDKLILFLESPFEEDAAAFGGAIHPSSPSPVSSPVQPFTKDNKGPRSEPNAMWQKGNQSDADD